MRAGQAKPGHSVAANGLDRVSEAITATTLERETYGDLSALRVKLRDQDRHELRRRCGKVDRGFHRRAHTTLSIELNP